MNIDGGDGSDIVNVYIRGGDTNNLINVLDTGATGTDTLNVYGTDQADNFLLRASDPTVANPIAFVAALHGDPHGDPATVLERINYNKNLENLVLDAAGGNDNMTLDDNWAKTTVLGGTGEDTFQVGQIFKTPRDANANIASPNDYFQTTATTRGYLSNGVSYDTTIDGGDNNDTFVVFRNLAPLTLLGGKGDDNFTLRAFAAEGSHTTAVSGQGGNDYVEYVLNDPVSISGGDGYDTVKVIGTEFTDQIVVTASGVFGMGINVTYQNDIESLSVDAAEGNDTFYILSTNPNVETHLYGGLGSDRFLLAADVPELFSGNTVIFGPQAGPHNLGSIAYDKLTIDGGLSEGTTGGLGNPVMLPSETNQLPSIGNVIGYQGLGEGSAA